MGFHRQNHSGYTPKQYSLRWPKWAIAKVFSKSRKKFSDQEKGFQVKKKFQSQEHANTIKNSQTRSKTRKSTIEIFVSKSWKDFRRQERIYSVDN